MSDPDPPIQLMSMASAAERMFPTLKPEQIERIAGHGRIYPVQDGDVLVEAGAQNTRFFLVRTGRLEIVRPPGTDKQLVASLGPGQFTGETSMLAGRRAMVQIQVREARSEERRVGKSVGLGVRSQSKKKERSARE